MYLKQTSSRILSSKSDKSYPIINRTESSDYLYSSELMSITRINLRIIVRMDCLKSMRQSFFTENKREKASWLFLIFDENIVFGFLYLILPKRGIYNRRYI